MTIGTPEEGFVHRVWCHRLLIRRGAQRVSRTISSGVDAAMRYVSLANRGRADRL
jgi:hypothetical protein